MQKVTLGASAAKTVVEEYVDANLHQKRRRPGNERLKKDRDYLQSLSRLELEHNHNIRCDPNYFVSSNGYTAEFMPF